ncbi:hypothetical protein AAGG74_15930 [Bacillus mexicanus]|uniref:hypothetical protein n=1 Tax=Bacillus mexicanus TaxID=2834415 RepID=UPI003D1A8CF8
MDLYFDNNTPTKDFKMDYERALDWFLPLRKKEESGQHLSNIEKLKYEWILSKFLLPLTEILLDLGEEKYLKFPENRFTYNSLI